MKEQNIFAWTLLGFFVIACIATPAAGAGLTVLNGSEIGSGSIRIHTPEIQKKVFNIIGLSDEEAKEKFGFILDAFRYGAPPHGGVAFGFDRIVAILCGLKSIKDVIAFPKTVSASSLMDNCPSYVDEKQLKDLGIIIS